MYWMPLVLFVLIRFACASIHTRDMDIEVTFSALDLNHHLELMGIYCIDFQGFLRRASALNDIS